MSVLGNQFKPKSKISSATKRKREVRNLLSTSEEEEEEDLQSLKKRSKKRRSTFSREDEIIKLLDSSDEEEYINSQLVHDDPTQREVDMSSLIFPISDVELSEEELNDEEMETEEEVEDEDEIQILKESQNSLYFKIKKAIIKTEPKSYKETSQDLEQESQEPEEPEKTHQKEDKF